MKDKRHVIWDWNGTLFNDARRAHHIINRMQRARGISETTFYDYQRFYEHPIELLYQRTGFNFAVEPYEAVAHEWHETYIKELHEIELQHDALLTLEAFRARNLEQVVLSALPHDILLQAIASKQVQGYFSHIQGLSDRAGRSKIDNGRALMATWGVEPEKTVLIGDSTHDFETAQALSIDCILVARGFEDRARLERHGVPVLDDFSALLRN